MLLELPALWSRRPAAAERPERSGLEHVADVVVDEDRDPDVRTLRDEPGGG
jgi:hypothetical protein